MKKWHPRTLDMKHKNSCTVAYGAFEATQSNVQFVVNLDEIEADISSNWSDWLETVVGVLETKFSELFLWEIDTVHFS